MATPTATLTPPGFAVEVAAILLSCASFDIARDPDPNFTQIAIRQPISLPTLNALPPSSGKDLAGAWLAAIADLKAVGSSLGKFEGAKAANNRQWMLAQLQAAQAFQQTLAADLLPVRNLTATFVQDLQAGGFQATQGCPDTDT